MTTAPDALEIATKPRPGRVGSIDLLRGLVMIVMVLDHVRDFFGNPRVDPTNLDVTTPSLFFTRWITHFCAPTFMLLSGVSASLSGAGRSPGRRSLRLLTRGLWLILLEETWGNVFLFFNYPHFVLALVLWAIGWSMIVLSALIHLPRPLIGAIGLALIFGHNAFDRVAAESGPLGTLWSLLHVPGFRVLPGGLPILVAYPLIPWIGVMALGYTLGPIFTWPVAMRRATLLAMGFGSIAGFLVLRGLNFYGNPTPWLHQSSPIRTAISFLNCQKYPPSLLFLLMTLGPAFLGLAALERGLGPVDGPIRMFGRVPLFFYLLQWPIAHGLALAVAWSQGEPVAWMFAFPPFQAPPGYGHGLPVVYLFWALTVLLMYPLCRGYVGRVGRGPLA